MSSRNVKLLVQSGVGGTAGCVAVGVTLAGGGVTAGGGILEADAVGGLNTFTSVCLGDSPAQELNIRQSPRTHKF